MKTQREKFEAWANKYHGSMNMGKVGDVYSNHSVMHDWFLWQAAIESAVVELPEPHQDEWKDLNLSTDEVVKALGDAGVKYVLPETFVRY